MRDCRFRLRMGNRWQGERGGGERGKEQSASRTQLSQCCSGGCISLCGGEAVQSDGLCSVLRNASAVVEHGAQVALSVCIPLCRCKAEESHSLCIVLRNAPSLIVAVPNHILAHATARSSALPSQL